MQNVAIEKKERDSNFELLRIIAMFMIVASHYAVHGVRHTLTLELSAQWLDGILFNRILTSFLMPGGTIGNGIFFLLTGYFMFGKPYKVQRLIKLIAQVYFYAVALLIAWAVIRFAHIYSFPELKAISQMMFFINAVIPITSGGWWFIQTYVVLFLFIPVLNSFIEKLSLQKQLAVIAVLWIFWYAAGIFSFGYSKLQQACFFYILGAYLKRKDVSMNTYLALFLFICVWLALSLLDIKSAAILKSDNVKEMLVKVFCNGFSAVIRPFAVVFIFLFCKSLKIGYNRFINAVASSTFGIYLIHDSAVGRQFIWNKLLHVSDMQYQSVYFPLYAVLSIVAVFAVCSLIELLRKKIFAKVFHL